MSSLQRPSTCEGVQVKIFAANALPPKCCYNRTQQRQLVLLLRRFVGCVHLRRCMLQLERRRTPQDRVVRQNSTESVLCRVLFYCSERGEGGPDILTLKRVALYVRYAPPVGPPRTRRSTRSDPHAAPRNWAARRRSRLTASVMSHPKPPLRRRAGEQRQQSAASEWGLTQQRLEIVRPRGQG
jgi:hypothetical protein